MEDLYRNLLRMDDVDVCVDYTKEQIIAKFDELETMSKEFAEAEEAGHVLCFFVTWIGFKL